MGAHVVAARPKYPGLCPPKAPKLLFRTLVVCVHARGEVTQLNHNRADSFPRLACGGEVPAVPACTIPITFPQLKSDISAL